MSWIYFHGVEPAIVREEIVVVAPPGWESGVREYKEYKVGDALVFRNVTYRVLQVIRRIERDLTVLLVESYYKSELSYEPTTNKLDG